VGKPESCYALLLFQGAAPGAAGGQKGANSAAKAKQFLPFLQRSKRLPAIVDYVLSGHRYKLLIPKETCAIAFSLSGVRCPGRGEPYADDAIAFMRRRIQQHDVEVSYVFYYRIYIESPMICFSSCLLKRSFAYMGRLK
jgi:hypothetical protein